MKERLEYVDALRGIAILGVILDHSGWVSLQTGHTFELALTGQRGVQLFYMVSAFTLYLSLDSPRKEHHRLSNFFIRRFFRIAPLFYLAILLNMLLYSLKPHYSPLRDLGWFQIALGFLFLNGASPKAVNTVAIGGWSVAVETTFYLLLPLLHRYIKTIPRAILLFVVSGAILEPLSMWLASRAIGPPLQTYFSLVWFPAEFPVFVLGILTYFVWKKYVRGAEGHRDLSLLLILASGLIFWGCLPSPDRHLYSSSLLFLTLILALSIHPWAIFVNPFTRFLGKISYSLYLLHFFVDLAVGSLFSHLSHYPASRYILERPAGLVLSFLLILGPSIPIAMFTWKYIEEPCIRLGRIWIAGREGRAVAAPELRGGIAPESQF